MYITNATRVERFYFDCQALQPEVMRRELLIGLEQVWVYGIWYMVHGIWYMVHGIWYMVHGIWYMVHGIWYMVHGTWYMVYGTWCMVYVGLGG